MTTAAVAHRASLTSTPSAAPDFDLLQDVAHTRKRVKRAESLFRVGSAFDSLYAVRVGFFKSTILLEDGRTQVAGFHMAGEILGLDGIGTDRHAVDMIALEDSEVCIVPLARLEERGMQRQLQRVMSRELVRDHGVMALLGTMRAQQRVAAFLLNLSQRFVARGYSSTDFHLRMTREEIGSYLGLSLETVSRLFSRFHECGYIAIDQKHVLLRHVAGLRGLLQHRHIERSGGAPKRGAAGSFGAPIPRTANSPPRFLHQINPLNRS